MARKRHSPEEIIRHFDQTSSKMKINYDRIFSGKIEADSYKLTGTPKSISLVTNYFTLEVKGKNSAQPGSVHSIDCNIEESPKYLRCYFSTNLQGNESCPNSFVDVGWGFKQYPNLSEDKAIEMAINESIFWPQDTKKASNIMIEKSELFKSGKLNGRKISFTAVDLDSVYDSETNTPTPSSQHKYFGGTVIFVGSNGGVWYVKLESDKKAFQSYFQKQFGDAIFELQGDKELNSHIKADHSIRPRSNSRPMPEFHLD